MNEISKETFEQMDNSSKLNVLFDLQVNQRPHCARQAEACDTRFKEVEGRVKKWGLTHLFLIPPFSFFGGFIAFLTKTFFGGN